MRGRALLKGLAATVAAVGVGLAPALAIGADEDGASAPVRKTDRLVAFNSCDTLVGHFRSRALRLANEGGVRGYPALSPIRRVATPALPVTSPAPEGAPPPAPPPTAVDAPQRGVDFSGSNVQEEGVDEPDIVKTDGRRLFTIDDGTIYAVDVTGAAPRQVGSMRLGFSPTGLLLVGDRLLVLGSGSSILPPPPEPVPLPEPVPTTPPDTVVEPFPPSVAPPPPPSVTPRPAGQASNAREHLSIAPGHYRASTVLLQVDVSNPAAMRVLGKLEVDGGYVAARLVGDTARIVVAGSPSSLPLTYPGTTSARTAAEALAFNRRAIRRAGVRTWLPQFRLTRRGAGRVVRGQAVRCRNVRRPQEFSGLGTISVLTVDAAGTMRIMDSDAIMSDGETVYGSPNGLYVATTRWFDQTQAPSDRAISNVRTTIHRFSVDSPTQTTYQGSGSVPGFLLNQFSLSEHEGNLRVASTEEPPWNPEGQQGESESGVTILAPAAGGLAQVGRVTGLGRGERIYAVRFLGERGYVVTFRQVDPLYVLDLSDPASPRVRGELKIPGFSSYLHPVGEDRLIGIGQDADGTGRVQGSQISLFDVSDPANPRRLAQAFLGKGWSEAESDHLAFLYWPRTSLLVVPLSTYEAPNPFTGAVGLRVGPSSIDEVARITHPVSADFGGHSPSLRRSVVIRDSLLTISSSGIRTSDLDTLADRDFLPLR